MRKLMLLLASLVVIVGSIAAQQPDRLTEEFFPDPEVDFETPAFKSAFGFTKYKELIAFMESLAMSSDFATIEYLGETQKGRKIPLMLISKPSSEPKVRVWMQGGIHGNEPASSEGMLAVLNKLITDESYAYLFDKIEIAIVPMVNIDGYMGQNRLAKNGLDLNRDLIKLQIKETQQLRERYSEYVPHVAIDFHEYNPFRAAFRDFGSMGYTSYYDAMFLYSSNLNVEPEIRSLTENLFVNNAKSDLGDRGYTHNDYFSPQDDHGKLYFNIGSTSARSSATSFALGNAISILMEIRGIRLNRNSFERRVLITETAAMSYLQTAYENQEEVLQSIERAINSTTLMERDVVVDSKRDKQTLPLKFIDIGDNEMVESEFEIANAKDMKPTLVRDRPKAYLLPKSEENAIKNLIILGVTVDTLKIETRLLIDTYQVITEEVAVSEYQDYYPKTVQTEISRGEKTFQAGTFIIRMDQKNANLAVTALEPESDNGFVRTRVIEVQTGIEIPIYRLINQTKNIP